MSNLKPGVQGVMTCDALHAQCGAEAAGHGINAIRERAAAATPSKWRDAFVGHIDAAGWIALDLFDALPGEETRVWVWHHADLTESVSLGQPVALHGVYDVLAAGKARVSVVVTAGV